MAMMAGKLYTALIASGASEGEAVAAAEEAVSQETRFQKIETDLALLKWRVGTGVALQVGLIGTIVAFAINHATFR